MKISKLNSTFDCDAEEEFTQLGSDMHPLPELGTFLTLLTGTIFRNMVQIFNAYYWLGAEGAIIKTV